MAMVLPEARGTYVLIASVAQMKRLEIGRLGAYDIVPGFYAYVGSAFGSGGLRVRIGHHLESTASVASVMQAYRLRRHKSVLKRI
jgi:Uri superfamily endonuclease